MISLHTGDLNSADSKIPMASSEAATFASLLRGSPVGDVTASTGAYHAKQVIVYNSQSGKGERRAQYAQKKKNSLKAAQKNVQTRIEKIKQEKKSKEKKASRVYENLKQKKHRLESHSGVNVIVDDLKEDFLNSFSQFWLESREDISTILDSSLVNNLENVAMLLINLRSVKDYSGFVSAIGLFCKIYLPSSMMSTVAHGLTHLLDVPVASVNDGFVLDSHSGGQSFVSIRDILGDFKRFRECELAKKVMTFVSMIVTMGLVKSSDLTFTLKGFELFRVESLRRQVTAGDFLECILETIKFFFERGSRCFGGEGIAAFFTDKKLIEYDEEYTLLMSKQTLFEVGSLAAIGMDEHEYDRRVDEITDLTVEYLKGCKPGERSYYSNRLEKLKCLRTKLTLAQRKTVRRKPLGILLFGGSSVGKSTMANALIRYTLAVNDFDHKPESIITLNEFDKFQSEYRSKHAGVIFDDLANGKPDQTDGNPMMKVIQFLNNIPMAALNPNVELKGNVMIQPEVVLGTTNVKHLNASVYSMEPLSIARRFDLTITVEVKPDFKKKGTDMLDPIKAQSERNKEMPEFNLFTVEEPFMDNGSLRYRPMEYKGRNLIKVELPVLLSFLRDYSEAHFAAQNSYVAQQLRLAEINLCEHKMLKSMCPHCNLESQFGVVASGQYLCEKLSEIEGCMVSKYSTWARTFLNTKVCTMMLYLFNAKSLKTEVSKICKVFGFAALVMFCSAAFDARMLMSLPILAFLCFLFASASVEKRRRGIVDYLSNVQRPSLTLRNALDETSGKIIIASIGGFTALYGLYKLYKKYVLSCSHMSPPISFVGMEDGSDHKEFWSPPEEKPRISVPAYTINFEELCGLVKKHLAFVRAEQPDGTWTYNDALPITGNVWLIPNHMVPDKPCKVVLQRTKACAVNCMLSRESTIRIEGEDLALWYLPEAGPQPNLLRFFPKDFRDRNLSGVMFFNDEGETKRFPRFDMYQGRVSTTLGGHFRGWNYNMESDTFKGLCLATIVSAAPTPFISGFHLAGSGRRGAAGRLTHTQLSDAIEKLKAKPNVLISHSAIDMPTSIMGVEFGPLTQPHAKSAVYAVENKGHLNVFGTHSLPKASWHSSVVTSAISKSVEEIMDLPKIHGPPHRMNDDMHWNVDIAAKTDVAYKFNESSVQKACIDFESSIRAFYRDNPKALTKIGKIADDAILAGYDGVKALNAMNFNSALGFPEKGPKTQHVEQSLRNVEGISCPRDIDPKYFEEVARIEQEFLKGNRVNTVFKGSLKDEPTKLTKKKVRVFAGCNTAFTLLMRKYFLSLAKALDDHTEVFECAVGTNTESPEWDELMKYVYTHGEDRIIAGDYAAFDGRMSPRFMFAAFKILINVAKMSGNYDEEDIKIMEGIASEVCSPTYDYNGVLLQFFGSNPSGHSLTVVINSLVNSLYLRYCYYEIGARQRTWLGKPIKLPLFKQVVAALTYGDDNIMSVSKGYDWFNHTALADEFASCGIKYTMADKEAKSIPFIRGAEASFLKNYAVMDPELGIYRAKCEENSIQKILHAHVKSDCMSENEHGQESLVNAMDKYFGHGREVYGFRREQLIKVAQKNDMVNVIPKLLTYDEQIERFCERYSFTPKT